MNENLIGIHACCISTDITDFARNGYYRAVPMIIYKINNSNAQYFAINRAIEIFREDMDYGNVRSILHGEERLLSIPGKAYNQMMQYVNKNVNKVIADMITYVVTKTINELSKSNPQQHSFFFIDSSDINKIIGRLGYLYLNSSANTIAFVTYKSGGLLTDILNSENDYLRFDLNYFKRRTNSSGNHSAIIPNDYMESLTQIVFYSLTHSGMEKQVSPLRCDILSQGISTSQIQEKVNSIEKVLTNPNNMTLPHPEGNGPNQNWVVLPKVLFDCISAEKLFIGKAKNILESVS